MQKDPFAGSCPIFQTSFPYPAARQWGKLLLLRWWVVGMMTSKMADGSWYPPPTTHHRSNKSSLITTNNHHWWMPLTTGQQCGNVSLSWRHQGGNWKVKIAYHCRHYCGFISMLNWYLREWVPLTPRLESWFEITSSCQCIIKLE